LTSSCSIRYIKPLLELGLKRHINSDDLPAISSADQTKLRVKLLDEHWSYERSMTALDPSLYRSLSVGTQFSIVFSIVFLLLSFCCHPFAVPSDVLILLIDLFRLPVTLPSAVHSC
jgi:hypothetical protein